MADDSAAYQRAWRARNPERVRAYNEKYRAELRTALPHQSSTLRAVA